MVNQNLFMLKKCYIMLWPGWHVFSDYIYILWLALELIFLAAMRHCELTLASSSLVALEGIK